MKKYFKNSSFVIFFIISIGYAIGNIIWWKINTPIIPNDMSGLHFSDVFQNSWVYYLNAPLITWIMKGMFFIFDKELFDLQIIIVNYIFFIIALYCIYKIGLELKDKITGNITMILFALTPAIYGMSRQYGHQDWHVMIAMVVNVYCLIKLNYFKNRNWSIFYGITVGLGLLIKDEFLAYFFTPWLYVTIKSLMEKTDKTKIINIFITILLGSLISGCHYFRFHIINKILNEPFIEVSQNIFGFDNIYMFTIGLSEFLLSPPIFVLFIISFIWFVFKYKNRNKWILILWFIIPWLIIIFMPHHKEPEYGIGFVPAIIIIVSIFLNSITKTFFRRIVLIISIILCVFQYLAFSYNLNRNLFDFNIRHRLYYFVVYNSEKKDKNFMAYTKNKEIISLVKYIKNNFNHKSVFIYSWVPNSESIVVYLKIKDFRDVYTHTNIINTINNDNSVESDFINNVFSNADIIVDVEKFSLLNVDTFFSLEKEHFVNQNVKVDFTKLKFLLNKLIEKIKKEYMIIDDFYLDSNHLQQEKHICVLAKKELLKQNDNIIKYKYKLEKE